MFIQFQLNVNDHLPSSQQKRIVWILCICLERFYVWPLFFCKSKPNLTYSVQNHGRIYTMARKALAVTTRPGAQTLTTSNVNENNINFLWLLHYSQTIQCKSNRILKVVETIFFNALTKRNYENVVGDFVYLTLTNLNLI